MTHSRRGRCQPSLASADPHARIETVSEFSEETGGMDGSIQKSPNRAPLCKKRTNRSPRILKRKPKAPRARTMARRPNSDSTAKPVQSKKTPTTQHPNTQRQPHAPHRYNAHSQHGPPPGCDLLCLHTAQALFLLTCRTGSIQPVLFTMFTHGTRTNKPVPSPRMAKFPAGWALRFVQKKCASPTATSQEKPDVTRHAATGRPTCLSPSIQSPTPHPRRTGKT